MTGHHGTRRTQRYIAPRWLAWVMLFVGSALPLLTSAANTTYYVGDTSDTVDATTNCTTSGNTTCSLREAINALNAVGAGTHTINLPTGTITITGASGDNANASGDYDLTSATAQTVNIIGTSSANTIISGGTLDRIFDATSATVAVNFTDLKLMSGSVASSGGCVQSAGNNLSFTRTIVTGCTASMMGKGGAVFINSTTAYTVTVADATFSNNTSASTGGAISAANVTISGTSTFSGNSASSHGGAIYAAAAAANNGIVTITGASTFTSNSSTGYGGAIYAMNNVDITGATFGGLGVGNHADTASQRGGAINVQGATGAFTNCTFSYNTTAGQGGAINGLNAITITNSTISNNTATSGNGGGIAAGTTLTINATSSIDHNTSGAAGGGAYAGGAVAITGSSITYNTAATNGGGLYDGSTLTIDGISSISNNSANGGQGGGAYVSGTVTVNASATVTMSNNTATSNGGGLYSGGALTLTNPSATTVNANTTGAGGGGIYAASTATVYGATITNNISNTATATIRGGGIAVNGNSTIDSSTISNNTIASGQGGGVATVGNFTLGISNSTISGNKSTGNAGGGVYGLGAVTITNSTVSSNTTVAASNAGGVYSGGLFTASGSTFTSNSTGTTTAGGDGGAVFAAVGASITSSTFNLNTATGAGRGGAIFNNSGTVTVSTTDSTFTSNSGTSGGAIYAAGGSSITRTSFSSNSASALGGAIYTVGAAGNLYGANTFTGNHAAGSASNAGGCIYTSQALTINNAGSVFSGNYGGGSGGCIWAGSTLNINGATTFDSNYTTTANGGGAIIAGGVSTITDATFVNNYAGDFGGAFYPLTTSTINTSTFEGNYLTAATTGGGAIYLKNAAYTVTINNSTFVGNNAGAGQGGAINTYNNASAVAAVYNSTFYNNTATGTTQSLFAGSAGKIQLYNSIVSHPASNANLCNSTGSAGNNNVEFNNTGTACTAATGRITTDPLLSTLAYNGGPTKTMALQTGSSAINASGASATASDQRGVAAVGTRDVGAYESSGSVSSISISGMVYSNEGVTAVGAGKVVRLIKNGVNTASTTTDSTGAYSITTTLAANDALLIYVAGDATVKGNTVTLSSTTSISGFNIYGSNDIITRNDNAGSLTNANMSTAKGSYSDTDILYSVSAGALTVSGASTTLYIPATHTFAPGGNVTTVNLKNFGTLTGGTETLYVSGAWTNSGTFTANTNTVNLNGASQTVNGSTTFNNLTKSVTSAATLTFQAGQTTTINGTVTLNGVSGQLLTLASSTGASAWSFAVNASATKAISYVSVSWSDASTSNAAQKPIAPTNSTDGGNTTSWFAAAGITISGTLYSDEGVTVITTGPTVRLIKNGASVGTAVANGSGVYSITASVTTGDAILAYIDNNGTYQGNTVTVSSGANLTNLHIFANRVITRHDNAGSLTNLNMKTALGAYVGTGILYSADASNNLTISGASSVLYTPATYTYAPGANVTTANMKNLGTVNLGATGAILTLTATGTPLVNSGTFTAGTSTVTYSGTTTATNIATVPYSSLQLAPTGATTYSLTGNLAAGNALTGSLTIGANATLTTTASNYNITLAGNWSNSGTFTANSSTVTLSGAAQAINGSTTFFNLTKSVTTATTLTFEALKTTTINGTVTLNGAAGQLLTLASSTGSSAWGFVVNSGATKAISYVSVSWSDASGSHATQKPIAPTNSVDGGNNNSWFATPSITAVKSSTIVSDPVNGATNPLHIPGAIITYQILTTNSGTGSPDANTVVVTDTLDSTTLDYDVTTGVIFTANTSGLTLGTVTYSQTSTPTTYTYTPTGPYDPNVAGIKVTTTGTLATGSANFTISFRVRVK